MVDDTPVTDLSSSQIPATSITDEPNFTQPIEPDSTISAQTPTDTSGIPADSPSIPLEPSSTNSALPQDTSSTNNPPAPPPLEPTSTPTIEPNSTISALPIDNPFPAQEPVSSIPADLSVEAPAKEDSVPAPQEPTSTIPAQSSSDISNILTVPPEVSVPSQSNQIEEPSSTIEQISNVTTDSVSQPLSDQSSLQSPLPATASTSVGTLPLSPADNSVLSPEPPSPQLPVSPSIPDTSGNQIDIPTNNALPENPPISEPSEAPNTIPEDFKYSDQKEEPVEPSSETKPPESPTMPSISFGDSPSPVPTTSFGDLLTSEKQSSSTPDLSSLSTPSNLPDSSSDNSPARNASQSDTGGQPTTDNPQPATSFGDLIKDIKPEESVIPPARDASQSDAGGPPVSSEPTVSPIPPPQSSPLPPPISSPPPPSPISHQLDQSVQLDQKLKEALAIRRQKANAVRIAKRQKMLDKLATEVKEKGKYTSTEAQQKFDLPQSTLGDYFQDLVNQGVIKKFGKGRGMYHTV